MADRSRELIRPSLDDGGMYSEKRNAMAKTVEEIIGSSDTDFRKVIEVVRDGLNAKKYRLELPSTGRYR